MTLRGRAAQRGAILGLWRRTAIPNASKVMRKTTEPPATVKPMACNVVIVYVRVNPTCFMSCSTDEVPQQCVVSKQAVKVFLLWRRASKRVWTLFWTVFTFWRVIICFIKARIFWLALCYDFPLGKSSRAAASHLISVSVFPCMVLLPYLCPLVRRKIYEFKYSTGKLQYHHSLICV